MAVKRVLLLAVAGWVLAPFAVVVEAWVVHQTTVVLAY